MRTGRCQCGEVRYESEGDALALYVCHCHECRKQSASAFGMSLLAPRNGFRVTQGRAHVWTRNSDSGRTVSCYFCPSCGSRLWHARDGIADTITIKAGSLDEPVDMRNAIHIWTSRKLQGVIIPENAEQYPKEPP